MSQINQAKISKQYNKLVLIFFIVAILLIIFTGYFAFAKTTITVTPLPEKAEADLEVNLTDIDGQAAEMKISDHYVYEDLAKTEENSEEGYATGKVTIYNNYVSDQPLVATTRLLSESGVLFRTQEDVTVPKGSSVEVEIKADEPGKNGDIEATKFEIVALNSAKKNDIYAESTEKMKGGTIITSVANEAEIAKAKEKAKEYLKDKAAEEFSKTIEKVNKENIAMDITKEEIDVEIDQVTDSINVDIEAQFYYTEFNKEKLIESCQNKLKETENNDYSFFSTNSANDIKYNIEYKNGQQIIKTKCNGYKIISSNSSLIDKSKLTNKTTKQLEKYLEDVPQIQEVKIKFSPFWVKTTPFIKENIQIKVEEL